MTWSVTAEPQRFDAAVEWFGGRVPLTPELVAELAEHAGPRAWTVAGVTQLDIVQSVHASLERAIANGTPFEEWQKQAEASLTKAWGRKDSPRMLTVFINSSQQSMNAGRWSQMVDPAVLALRPYGFFDGVVDERQSPQCRECDGTILPLDHPWWSTHSPQLHHRCRSSIRNMRESEVKRRGGVTASPSTSTASPGFGAIPSEVAWQPDPAKYAPALWREYAAKAADIAANAPRPVIPVD